MTVESTMTKRFPRGRKAFEALVPEGEHLKVGGNRPFLLDEPESVWLVVSGMVNVFSVHVHEGQPIGSRLHVATVNEGQPIFGIGRQVSRDHMGFIAVAGPDTELSIVKVSQLQELSQKEGFAESVLAMIDLWVAKLSSEISLGEVSPHVTVELAPDAEITLEDGQFLCPAEGVFWVTLREGRAWFMGRHDLPEIEPGHVIPVTPDNWLLAVDTLKVDVENTSSLLGRDHDLWDALTAFHRLLAESVHLMRQQRLEDQSRQLDSVRKPIFD